MASRVCLIRHGATDWSAQGRFTGHTDVPLNKCGRKQAIALGENLTRSDDSGRSDDAALRYNAVWSYDSVWSSDLSRCVETAALMGLNPHQTPELREFDFGELEGLCWDELPKEHQRGLLKFEGFCAPGGESVQAFGARVDRFLATLGSGRHLVITHGGVIRLLLRRRGLDATIAPGSSHEISL